MLDEEKRGALLAWIAGNVVKSVIGLGSALVFATLLIGEVSIGTLLYRADRELVYLVDHPGVRCGILFGDERCNRSWELAIGNTGDEDYDEVTIVLYGVYPDLQPAQSEFKDLEATRKRAHDPKIAVEREPDANLARVRVTKLAAGTYVRVNAHNLDGSRPDVEFAPSYEIIADGRLIEGDPQGSVLGRRLAGFFEFL